MIFLRKIIEPQSSKMGIELDFRFDRALKTRKLNLDHDRIKQVLLNLLQNSIVYTAKGHIMLAFKVEDETTLKIAVHDNGCGIEES